VSKIGALRDLLVALLHEHVRDGTISTNAELKKERTGARRRLGGLAGTEYSSRSKLGEERTRAVIAATHSSSVL